MKPFIKWPGGKEKEVSIISRYFPDRFDRFFEPFVGGGAVLFSLDRLEYQHVSKYINDISIELTSLYRFIKNSDELFFDSIKKIQHNWRLLEKVIKNHSSELLKFYFMYGSDSLSLLELKDNIKIFIIKHSDDFNGVMSDPEFNPCIDLFIKSIVDYITRRFKRLKTLSITSELDILNSIETAMKGAFYNHYRYIYNNRNRGIKISAQFASAIYYFIRENCYSSMFRYNKLGDFNIPYGGMAYNKKDFSTKIFQSNLKEYLKNTTIDNVDFEEFLDKYDFNVNDFIFVDPPYDSDFSKYANTDFLKNDHERLCNYLRNLEAKVMVVIKKTDYIEELYRQNGFYIYQFDKKYLVNCKNRNDRNVTHLIITNYEVIYSEVIK